MTDAVKVFNTEPGSCLGTWESLPEQVDFEWNME